MGLSKQIKQVVGTHLEKYGFIYQKGRSGEYVFVKTQYPQQLDQPEFYFSIYKERFGTNDLNFTYNVFNVGSSRQGNGIEMMKQPYSYKFYKNGVWHYETSAELAEILEEFNRLFDMFIWQELQQMSVPDKKLWVNYQMERALYENHDIYLEKILDKTHLETMSDEVFMEDLAERIMKMKEEDSQKQRETLMSLAALWGEKLSCTFKGHWDFREASRTCYVRIPYGRNGKCEAYEYPLTFLLIKSRESSRERIKAGLKEEWMKQEKKCKGKKEELPAELLEALRRSGQMK